MSFNGSLAEFDISNIFLLVEQDSATGELIVVTSDNRYVISFKNGQLINAVCEKESIRNFLFIYLMTVKNYSPMEIKELDTIFHDNNHLLSDELLKKGYLDQKELSIIVQTGIIDITSIVFGIKKGSYIFDTKATMDAEQFLTLAIPANFVLLESARKSDEEGQIGSIITPDAIFGLAANISPELVHDPITSFQLYALSHVDGARTVDEICERMFFSACHVYSVLSEAYRVGRITLLETADQTLSPLKKKVLKEHSNHGDIVMASTLTGISILIILFVGIIVLRAVVCRSMIEQSNITRNPGSVEFAEQRFENGKLLFQSINNRQPTSFRELQEAGIITLKESQTLRNVGIDFTQK